MSADTKLSGDRVLQMIFGTSGFGPSKETRRSFVMMKGTETDKAVFWFCKLLFLWRLTVVACETDMDLEFIRFM